MLCGSGLCLLALRFWPWSHPSFFWKGIYRTSWGWAEAFFSAKLSLCSSAHPEAVFLPFVVEAAYPVEGITVLVVGLWSLGGREFRLFLCYHLGFSLRHSLLSLWDRLQGSTDSSAVRPKTFKEATFELCVICHIYDLNFLCNYLISVHLSHQIVYSVKFVTISVFAHSLCCCKYKCIFDFSFFPQECYLHEI